MAEFSSAVSLAVALVQRCKRVTANSNQCRLLADRIELISVHIRNLDNKSQVATSPQRLLNEISQFISEFEGVKDG